MVVVVLLIVWFGKKNAFVNYFDFIIMAANSVNDNLSISLQFSVGCYSYIVLLFLVRSGD